MFIIATTDLFSVSGNPHRHLEDFRGRTVDMRFLGTRSQFVCTKSQVFISYPRIVFVL